MSPFREMPHRERAAPSDRALHPLPGLFRLRKDAGPEKTNLYRLLAKLFISWQPRFRGFLTRQKWWIFLGDSATQPIETPGETARSTDALVRCAALLSL